MSLEELLSSLDRQGIRLSARDGRLVVDAPTGTLSADLRDRLAARKADILTWLERGGGDEEPIIPRLPRQPSMAASPAQRRLWLLQRLDPADSRYNVNLLLELSGVIDSERIARSLSALMNRHEILRSHAREENGDLVIDHLDEATAPLEIQDAAMADAAPLIEAAMTRPFAMDARAPLFRALLVRAAPDRADPDRARLLLTFHHMIVDEESLKILAQDWAALYADHSLADRPPAVQHVDATAWRRRRLDARGQDNLLAYWTEALGTDQPTLTLPQDPTANGASAENDGARVERPLPRATVERIARFCSERRITPYILLLTAYHWTLSRWSGQDDVRVATPVSERLHPALESVVGPMMNTLVMRARIAPGVTGLALLEQTRQTVLDGQRHSALPFEILVERLRPARDSQGEPLAQTMFNYLRGGDRATLDLGDVTATVLPIPEHSAKFDLSLFVSAPAGAFTLSFQHRTARFGAATIERFADHCLRSLDALLTAPERALDGLAALPPGDLERQRVWNATASDLGGFAPLGRLLSEQAARTPDAVALEWEADGRTERLSYAALDRRSNRLAHWLIAQGCRPDDRVALCFDRSPELVIAIHAAVKAGCAYLPLDPEHPAARLATMLEDGGAALALTQGRHRAQLPDHPGLTVAILDANATLADGRPDHLPNRPVAPGQLAYALFTSGSTGRPKAVGVPQAGLLNRLRWMQDRYRLSPADAVLQKTPYGFDVSVWEFFWPLMTGARLVLAGPGEHRDAARLTALIETHGVTTLHFVPAMLQVFLDALEPGRCAGLTRLLCSGEALPAALRDRCLAALPAELHNLYGPTEASIDVTVWDCRAEPQGPVPIGRPIANIQTWILDGALNPVPVGVAGELYLSGIGLARGYLGRPGLTAAAFLPNPLADGPDHRRLYRTGDLARHRPDGAIEYLGRADFQVKIRGQRVELGEIEAALAALPGVAEAVVVASTSANGEATWLTAWIVPPAGVPAPTPDEARAALAHSLPDHMIPAVLLTLDRMPINQNGKIDRKALPQPQPPDSGGDARNAAEQTLATLWRALLRVERVGVNDNFFMLGGDSIISLQLSTQARAHGLLFEPRAVFRHQTIATLAAHATILDTALPEAADVVPSDGPTPLTGIQRWWLDSQPAVPDHNNQAVLLTADARVNEAALRAALTALLARHPTLSAQFQRVEGRWTQNIPATPRPLSLRVVAVTGDSQPRIQEAIDAEVADTQTSLSLAEGRLFAAALLRLPDGGDRLLLVAHHLAVDGVSWRILLDDLANAYAEASAGRDPAALARHPTTSFRRWALAEGERRAALPNAPAPLWASLSQRPPDALPLDHPLPPDGCKVGRQIRHSITLPAEAARRLTHDAPTAFRTGPEALCLTALARALTAWRARAGQTSTGVTLFMEGHGRDLLPLDSGRTVGWFTRLHPARLETGGQDSLSAALLSTRAALAALPESEDPYLLRWDRDGLAIQSPILFNYLGRFDEQAGAFRRAPEPLGHFRAPDNALPWLIEVNASVGPRGLTMSWQAAGEVLDPATVERLAADTLAELSALAALCAEPGPGGAIAADFPLADLAPGDLDAIAARHPLARVEDVYRLSPMQRGMLLHSLGGEEGQYVSQTTLRCDGALDPDLLQQACQRVVDRHPSLRTAFLADGLSAPCQIVLRRARFALRWESLLDADATERAEALDRIAREDRAAIALDRPPLLRCSVLRTAARRFQLVWTIHHLVMDGWSLPLLTADVLRHYAALRAGADGADAPPPVPYRDFIAWLDQRDGAADARFWQEELADFPGAAPLPGARLASGLGHHTEEHAVSVATSAALRALCRDRRLTLNSVIQGLWALVMARHAGVEDLTVGVTLAGRPADLPGAERCLGTFINTVPLRIRPAAAQPMAAFLDGVQRRAARIRDHGHAPLARIRDWAGAPDALFHSIIVSEALPPGEATDATGLTLTRETTEVRNSYPLTLRIVPSEALRFDLLLDHDRVDPLTARRMMADLIGALDDLAGLIDRPLSALFQRLAPPPSAAAPTAPNGCALTRLLAQPADAVALEESGVTTSYAALRARAGGLAARLSAKSCGAGGMVAVVLPRVGAHIDSVIAAWWLGAAWVALDPALPAARLAWMAADSGATVAVGAGERPLWLPETLGWLDWTHAEEPCEPPPPVLGSPDRVAYLLYTSGSTGTPKGVAVTHGNLLSYVDAVMPHLDLPPDARLSTIATVSADLGLTSVFGALLTGRRLSLIPPELSTDPPGLADHLARHPVDALKIVPGHLLALLSVGEPARLLPRRCLILGGESLPPAGLARLRRLAPGLRIVNHYGPTETTIGAAAQWLDPAQDGAEALPIGPALANARAYVLDSDLEPVAGAAVGELFIGGLGVSRGYHRRPGQTAERFLPDPWLSGRRMYRTGDRVRRTPDGSLTLLGRADDQVKIRGFRVEPGELRHILAGLAGVEDSAILVDQGPNGARLGALVAAPARDADSIRAELAGLVPDPLMPSALRRVDRLPLTANGKLDKAEAARLLAAPVSDRPEPTATPSPKPTAPNPTDPTLERLQRLWAEILGQPTCGPDDHFFRMGGDSILCLRLMARAAADGLRLTTRLVFEHPTPALLAAALRPPAPEPQAANAPASAPVNGDGDSGAAAVLRPLWATLLGRPVIADDDHFFRLGGDSIMALRLIALAARQGVRLTARDLFEQPLFRDLVRAVDPAATTAAPPPRADDGAPFALAPIQRWFLEQPQPHPDHWNQAVMLALPEGVDATALRVAVHALVASQPMLRARLVQADADEEPRLTLAAEATDARLFAIVPCSDEAAVDAAVAAAHSGLSLRDGPLFRAVLIPALEAALETPARDARLLLVAHHMVVDGVSWRIIAADLRAAYEDARQGRTPVPPPPADGFAAWTAALSAIPDDRLDAARRYWGALADHPGWGELARGADPGTLSGLRRVELALDDQQTAVLLRQPDGVEATLLAALARALGEWQNRADLVIELEGHGREPDAFGDSALSALDPSRSVGWFTSRYPVRLTNDPAQPGAIRRQRDAAPGRGLGYGLLRYLRVGERLPPHPQLAFNYLGQVPGEAGGWRLIPDGAGQARHPDSRRRQLIDVTAQLREGRLSVVWAFPKNLPQGPFVDATARRFLDHLGDLLDSAPSEDSSGPSARLSPSPVPPSSFPLTPLQQGMLWHTLAAPDERLYVNQTAVQLDGALDPAAFAAAWQETVDAEPILRTGFTTPADGPPVQTVAPTARFPWALEDWSDRPADGRNADLRRLMADDRAAGFALDEPPLMRLRILRLADDRHWLLWSRHHLIVDAWSTAMLIADVFHRYRNRLGAGLPPPVPRPPFAAYLAWLARRDAAADHAFWAAELAGASPLPDFPTGPQGAEFRLTDHALPESVAVGARALARRVGVTLNSVIQAAWAITLGRHTGADDVLFGMTTAGRPPGLAGADRMLGAFINTVPVRVRLNPAETVAALLDSAQRRALSAREHEHTPLADIQRCAGLARGQALFQSLLVFENEGMGDGGEIGAGVRLTPLSAYERTNYPLTLTIMPRGGLTLRVGRDERRIAPALVTALLDRFTQTLTALAENDARPVGALPVPADGVEKGPSVPAHPGWWVGRAILDQSARARDALALETSVGPMSYGALTRSALALARGLRKRGVGPEDRVALRLERGPALVVALLGVLFSGAAYVPLDPAQPESRLADILDQAKPRLILAPANSGQSGGVETVSPDALIRDGQETEGDGWLPAVPHPEQTAYVIFTSGSTGRPKGVAVRHAGLSNLLRAMADVTPLTPADRWLAVTTIGFDIAALEIFAPLIAGAAVVLADETAQRDPAALLRLLDRHRVTVLQATPASWAMLAELDSPAWVGLRALTGGEALPAALAERLLRRGARLTNVYGPTETTIWSSATPVESVADGQSAVPIGGPLDNTSLYVLDAALNPLPPGAEGELWIGGDGLARGYHARPGLTASAFLPDPFAAAQPGARPGARMYRTGDLVRRGWDGALRFVGRRDFQVKLRGHRIELGEIEAALLAQPGVAAAAVRLWDAGTDAAFLAAYAAGSGLDPEALRRGLVDRLPAAMIPASLLTLDALPLNPNGKIDRDALPRPGRPAAANRRPPQGDAEHWLAALWQDLLGVQDVARDDDFFALGGNSLTATRLVAAVRERLELPIPFTLPFQHPTLAALAAELRAAERRDSATLVTLRAARADADSSIPPLFLFHPAGGHARAYTSLAQSLPPEIAILALQSPQLSDPNAEPESIDTLATLYARLIRERQPNGPYRLLGWSLGAWLAMAVAARLEAAGATVSWVGLVDSRTNVQAGALDLPDLPLSTPYIACLDGSIQRVLLDQHRETCRGLERELASLPAESRANHALDWFRATLPEARDRPRDLQALQMRFFMSGHRLMRNFSLPRVMAPLHVWWARDTLKDTPHRRGADPQDWRAYGAASIRLLDGDHQSIPRSPQLARDVRALLACPNITPE
ncbi:amino acid adenylation domain-containing protein [Azospirillum cavernae]|uniref:Amino acid adenylation domain-containing protein n=1 Tax=Azospirillum cavernae TaxID=2320860 RepID=A0A418W2A4_9PROT|nr:non-ribosomal peptide synthetase [Azospirillum cavernae]RJF84163.1 amino acid adenylation domain-containing protein [Azospirillum cavernae]